MNTGNNNSTALNSTNGPSLPQARANAHRERAAALTQLLHSFKSSCKKPRQPEWLKASNQPEFQT